MKNVTIELHFADGVVQVTGASGFVDQVESALASKIDASSSEGANPKATGNTRRRFKPIGGGLRRRKRSFGRRRVFGRIM